MFPALFIGLSKLKQECHIELTPDAQPHCLYAPRRVPLPLQEAVNAELQRMQDEGVISPVTRPTDWCSGMVVVRKKNGKVRICVDYTRLNRSVRREHHVMPTTYTNLAKLGNAKLFSKVDARSGSRKIPLSEK